MTELEIKTLDKGNMFDVLSNFSSQCEDALKIAEAVDLSGYDFTGIDNIVLNGLGGSAIGGDLVRGYLQYSLPVPMFINRNYSMPGFASDKTLSIISSYSGDTEETNAAFIDSLNKNCKIICITSGGKVESLAKENNLPVFKLPKGFQPRCAVGYSFFIVLKIIQKLKLAEINEKEISETIRIINDLSTVYSSQNEMNTALKIAESLKGKLPVIYSGIDVMDVVNYRWRGQICENAETLAFGNIYPEMNHNELVGWRINKDVMKNIVVIYLRDKDDNERIKLRMDITKEIYKRYSEKILEISGNSEYKLARIFEMIYLGDWISFYLAILNNVDPSEIEPIHYLKKKLSEM
ncbi:MAG TPA: bifunctional phosphoglucose/phosphomannose isomerase [Bacteroidetes bacterium]|nr:bifunctional phosphoglucose/phosphomannose isomerase [Bacteroidota bacterium]HCN36599.1 bifunctional phosphoglucose/phosphomannose isomerase [Bacteroidota bacterium]